MILTIRRGALVAGSLLCLSLGGAALAQPAPPPEGAGRDAMRHPGRDPAEREADHARRLSAILQLRPEQEGALHAFLDAVKPPADMDDRMGGDHEQDEALRTPERLDHMLTHFDQMRARLAARVEAAKAFYAQLTPAQQQAFDAIGGGFGMHDHGDWRGGEGEHEHGEHDHGEHGPDGPSGGPGGDRHG